MKEQEFSTIIHIVVLQGLQAHQLGLYPDFLEILQITQKIGLSLYIVISLNFFWAMAWVARSICMKMLFFPNIFRSLKRFYQLYLLISQYKMMLAHDFEFWYHVINI